MKWRRFIFWVVYAVTYVPLFVAFVFGYVAEGAMSKIQDLDNWSRSHA